MNATEKKPALSPTRLDMLARCGMQYFFRYVEGLRLPPGVAMVQGTAVHRAVEQDLRHKRDHGKLMTLPAVEDCAAEALENTWLGEEPALDAEERAIGRSVVKARAKDDAVYMVSLHHRELAPSIIPVHLEREFRLELTNFPFDLVGVMDVQEPDAIRDVKVSGRAPDPEAAEISVQLTTYALAAKVLDGQAPAAVTLDYLVHPKGKLPYQEVLKSTRGEEDFARLLRRVEAAARVIQAGAFMPAVPDAWNCSPKWCGFYADVCPFGRRHRVQV